MTAKRDNDKIPALGSGTHPSARPSRANELGGGASGDAFFGSGTFDADDFGDSLDLALDDGTTAGSGSRPAVGTAAHDDAIERTAEGARSLPARPLADDGHWPTGTSPNSAAIEIDPSEIALTAEYGEAPASVLGTPAYALRALTRRKALGVRVRELDAALTAAEAARDQQLSALVSSLDAALRTTPEGRRLLEPVIRIEALADERRVALTGVSAEFEQRLVAFDDEEAALGQDRTRTAAAVEQAAAVKDERKHAHDRLDARKKRLYIEVRGILAAVEKAGGTATAEQTAQIAAREAEVAAQKPALDDAERAAREAAAAVAAAEDAAREVRRRQAELARQKAALTAEFQKQAGAHSHGVDEAESHRLQASVEAARGVLAGRGRVVDVPRSTRDELSRADELVSARARDLERHLRALDSYDRAAMKTGVAIVAGTVAAILLVVLLVLR